jgi:hypothetical protein
MTVYTEQQYQEVKVRNQRKRIQSNLSDIGPEQIGACTLVWDDQKKENFYLVANSNGDLDEDDNIIEYPVRWNRETGFSCECESGKHGWWNVTHPSSVCWHVRAAVACAMEQDQAFNQIAQEQAQEAVVEEEQVWTDEELGSVPAKEEEVKEAVEPAVDAVARGEALINRFATLAKHSYHKRTRYDQFMYRK